MESLKPQVPWPKRTRRAIRAWIFLSFLWLWGRLPLGLAAGLGRSLGSLGWKIAGKYRRLSLAHLKIAFPELSEQERESIGRNAFRHLGWCAAEVAQFKRLDPMLSDYVHYAPGSFEVLKAAVERGKGVMVVTGHVGNWEFLARRISLDFVPFRVIARDMNAPALRNAMDNYRKRGRLKTLWRGTPNLGQEMLATFKQGDSGLLGILIDQDTKVKNVWLPFFGQLAATPRVVGDLAQRFDGTVLASFCQRRPEGGYEIRIREVVIEKSGDPELDSRRITTACSEEIEAAIRRSPAEWVWMHERWKTPPPEGEGV